MGAKDQLPPARYFVDRLNETDAPISESADHVEVVDDLMEDIDGRSISLQRPFYSLHSHLDTGAKPARFCQNHFFNGHSVNSSLDESGRAVNQSRFFQRRFSCAGLPVD